MLIDNGGAAEGGNVILRVVLAGALVGWAARSDRPWLVGIALAIAQPALTIRSVAVGVAALALFRQGGGNVRPSGQRETGSGFRNEATQSTFEEAS